MTTTSNVLTTESADLSCADPRRRVPTPIGWLACLLSAATPNDALVGLSGGQIRSPSFLVGVAFTASGLLMLPQVGRTLVRSRELLLFAVAFTIPLLILVASLITEGAPYSETYFADKPVKLLLMALLLTTVARDTRWRPLLARSYVVGWWVFVLVSLSQIALGRQVTSEHFQIERVSILGLNENAQAVTAASGIVLIAASAFRSGSIRRMLHFIAALGAGGFVFVVANSRTALVALAAGLLTVLAAEARSASYTSKSSSVYGRLVVVVAVSVAMAAWAMTFSAPVENAVAGMGARITAALEGTDRGERDVLAAQTFALARDNLLGLGYGRTWDHLGDDPHNDFLKMAAEGGLVGVFALTLAVVCLGVRAWRTLRIPGEAGYAGALVLLGITALAGQGLVRTTFWLFFAIVTACRLPSAASHGRRT